VNKTQTRIGKVKCRRSSCQRATRSLKAAGWAHMDAAPAEFPHWVGWWCPECFDGLRKLMQAQGVEPDVERLQ
jgi:hypothetical protein